MDKLLIAIEVPSVDQMFDITVPWDLSAELLVSLLYQLMQELGSGLYVPSYNEVLCRWEDGRLLDPDQSMRENGIKMGDHLILF